MPTQIYSADMDMHALSTGARKYIGNGVHNSCCLSIYQYDLYEGTYTYIGRLETS